MQILTTVALSPAAGAFDVTSSYLVEAVTERDGVTSVVPGTRWTNADEAQRAARGAMYALVAHLRRDLGADPDPAEVAALRTDPKALTVSWVAGEPCDETLVWRKSWRVVEDTTPRTVRPAVAMSCVAILAVRWWSGVYDVARGAMVDAGTAEALAPPEDP